MPLRNSVIQGLKSIAGEASVLTDAEDLYVYSFEQFFRKRQYPKLDAVVKAASNAQIKEIIELAGRENIEIMRRGTEGIATRQVNPTQQTVLIDDATPPQLTLLETEEKELHRLVHEQEIQRAGIGSFRNFALALKSFFSGLPARKCLDCNVCSGYCTVAPSFNSIETWSSKGRTLLTQALSTGELQPSHKLAEVLYTCSLCGLCFANCFESTQVRKAIIDGRYRLSKSGHAPELFTATAKNILEVGDPGGTLPSKRVAWVERLQRKGVFPEKAEVLYWVGCTTSTRTSNVAVAFNSLLTLAEADFTLLGEKEGCCGYVLLATGLLDEARENALRLVERVRATGAETLVTTCSGCYYTFKNLYPEMLDVELPCQVSHATQYTERLIEERLIVPHNLDMRVAYHDPCSLGRHSNIYESPRNVLKAVPNLDLVEMPLSRNRSRCCGAGGGLWSFNNSVATDSAVDRLVKDVAPLGVSALVTACPTCHINLRNASVRKSLGIKVYDVMEIMESATVGAPKEERPTVFS